MKKIGVVVLVGVALIAVLSLPLLRDALDEVRVDVPHYQRPAEVITVAQNWSPEQRLQFHHTPQGTRLVPYEWFKALEQPCFSPFGCGKFDDPAYLSRFGFIAGRTDPRLNPDGFPIGFAIDRDFVDPHTLKATTVVGLTCAACHTNEMHFGKYAVQIEGAPATIDVTSFQKALGLALAFNAKFPLSVGRYSRFEQRVLGANASDAQKAELKADYMAFLNNALKEKKVTSDRHIYDNHAGFRRTDALTRIGNQVFAADTTLDDNYAISNAPVRFPQIWDASWFNWVQYNSSISDPLVRNIGEALGVRAVVKLSGPDAANFENSINMNGLRTLEGLLAGPAPFQGLASPKWPSVFPALNQQQVARGAELYKQHCSGCHLPPVPELLIELEAAKQPGAAAPKHWWKNAQGNWYIKVTDIKLEKIGTDPHEAQDFSARKADTGDLKAGVVTARAGLELVTKGIGAQFFERNKIPPDERIVWAGGRDPNDVAVRDQAIYKARPLNGIWAAAPFLHNGSVPNLYQLLSPQAERPSSFWSASKEFDPVKVGYEMTQIPGATPFDTTTPGNSNVGHEFKDGQPGKGVIGPALSPDDRMSIIEYLKSL